MNIKNIQDIVRPSGSVVFVTGVTGQDGSHMIDYLLRETSASVIGGARRLSVENHDNIKHLENEPRFQLVTFDLTDSQSVNRLVAQAKPDYFINFAAQSFVAASWDLSLQTLQANVVGVVNGLEAIRCNAPMCRFYNAGSSEEFGNVEFEPQNETHPLKPRSPYGASKASARHYVKVYRESFGLYAVQGWLFNHEGTRRGEEFVTRKITKAAVRIDKEIRDKSRKTITPLVLGNLDARRDWSDAEDMMDAVWRMLNQEKYNKNQVWLNHLPHPNHITNQIKDYVVASGEGRTIREFVEAAFDAVGIRGMWSGEGVDEHLWYESGPEPLPSSQCQIVKVSKEFYRPAEVNVLRGDASLIKRDLGWAPKTTFNQLVKKMVENDSRLTNTAGVV